MRPSKTVMSGVLALGLMSVGSVSALDGGGLALEPAAPAGGVATELQAVQQQLQQISVQLGQIQQQAFEVQAVMDAIAEYEQALRAKMVALSPQSADDIAEAEAMVEELRAVEDPAALPPEEAQAFQEKYMEFQQTVQRLQPVEREASQDAEIVEAQQELETLVTKEMEAIDPDAPQLLAQHQALIQRYMTLEQELQAEQTPPAPGGLEIPEF